MTPAETLRLSRERDRWVRRLHDAERAAYRRGFRTGFTRGWRACLDRAVVESLLRAWPRPENITEAEARRYGPGGRERFGDPRPGDFPGRGIEYVRVLQEREHQRTARKGAA